MVCTCVWLFDVDVEIDRLVQRLQRSKIRTLVEVDIRKVASVLREVSIFSRG